MLRLRTILAVGLSACLHLVAPTEARAEIVHVVVKGQTLGRIAKRYRTSVVAIREANDLPRGAKIKPGLKLVIPGDEPKDRAAAKKTAGKAGAVAVKGEKDKRRRAGARGQDEAERWTKRPPRPGYVKIARGSEQLNVQVLGRKGRLVPTALDGLGRILRHWQTGSKAPIDPRLATLLGMVSDHFGGRAIHVVSGFRPYNPKQHTKHSNHNVGRAIDFRIEGVPNTVVRDYCRTFKSAGVGYYPNSTFVHLDVRALKTYWIDYSRPGEPPRYDPAHRPDDADESAGEVHEVESAASGSSPTQGGNLDSVDSLDGIRDTLDSASGKPGAPGRLDPSPSRRTSPAPGVP